MAEAEPYSETHLEQPASADDAMRGMWPIKWRWRISLALLIIILVGFAVIWLTREQIAGNLIDEQTTANGIEAEYEIESIGPQQQVLRNLVIGDPAAPDLTVEKVVVDIAYTLGVPEIARIELTKPRLYGTFRDGTFSLGALDPLLLAESDEPAALPEFDVTIIDGRAQIDSDYGMIGIKLEGEGSLNDDFEGILAATGSKLGVQDCSVNTATLYGDLTTSGGQPSFEGPVRLNGVDCADGNIKSADTQVRFTLTQDFSSLDGSINIESEEVLYAGLSLAELTANSDFTYGLTGDSEDDAGGLTLQHELLGIGIAGPNVELAKLSLDGDLRASNGFERVDWSARFDGEDAAIKLGQGGALSDARAAVSGTLLESLLGKFEEGLSRALKGGRLAGDLTLRMNEGTNSLIIPEARLRSASGETVLALSRLSYSSSDGDQAGAQRLSGNILTGGPDIPRINGRMEQVGSGDLALRLTMAEYRQGADSMAIPRMEVRQDQRGRVSFNGRLQAEGVIPGGSVRGLALPIEGTWSSASGLAVGQRCTELSLTGLTYSELTLQGRKFALCPANGGAMVRYDDAFNLSFATRDLELIGALSGTPASIAADRAVLSYPGPFELEGVEAVIGQPESALRLSIGDFQGGIGETIGGTFAESAVTMDIIPLNLTDLNGNWSFEDSVLRLSDSAFILTDRPDPEIDPKPRFEPLSAQAASLTLEDNRIQVDAGLRHAASGVLISNLSIGHDLSSGVGGADIDIPSLNFGDALQPADLTYLAKGTIALAEGTVQGSGRFDWSEDDVTSSGTFSTDNFDFATVFGPVRGVKGEIVFTDLINVTTAPSQVVEIASINTGIETLNGRIVYTLIDSETVRLEDGRWPLMGGEMVVQPTTIANGGRDGQNYVIELVGLDAAAFVAQAELTNLGVSGIFDGTLPVSFDALGNGSIKGGYLVSRPPGGNVSYIGELTYEDLGAMSNYVFQTLRSIDYSQMSVELNGNLAGEIITRFNIDGIRQGEGASKNFVTRKIAEIPIRFNINVRSENFFLLSTIARGLFDPSAFGDPIDQGLLTIEDGQILPRAPFQQPEPDFPPTPENSHETDDAQRRNEPAVQPPESEDLP